MPESFSGRELIKWLDGKTQQFTVDRAKLKELKGIEKELFNEVIVKGTNITRAVDKVAITYDVDVSTIWKNYYSKIKEDIKNLENLMKSSEILV